MEYLKIAESPLLYLLVIGGIVSVVIISLIFLRKSWIRAYELGFTRDQIMNVVKSSLTLTIVPSVAIVVGLFSLAAMLGVPWPWYRLSVIGSVAYELLAGNMALGALGKSITQAGPSDFTLIMYIMSLGILGGPVIVFFFAKKIQSGTMNLKIKDARWGALGNSVFMMTIVIVLIVPMILAGGVELLTLLTSAATAVVLGIIIKKFNIAWLNNFVLGICLIVAMASSVLWTGLLN